MVEWEAANISFSEDESSHSESESISDVNKKYDDNDQDNFHNDNATTASIQPTTNKHRAKRRRMLNNRTSSTETPEAAIARLTSAYNTAMSAVGALHKASAAIVKTRKAKKNNKNNDVDVDVDNMDMSNDKEKRIMDQALTSKKSDMDIDSSEIENINKEEEHPSLKRVALAARKVFENAVLSDPLVASYAPTLARTLKTETTFPTSISKAHEITIKELAYLSLVNYSDLILSCCACGLHRKCDFDGVLDRGAVQILGAVRQYHEQQYNASQSTCLWSDIEEEKDSKKLALASYCDAVDLDGSDPTTWLKLACGARSLGRELQERQVSQKEKEECCELDLLNGIKDYSTFNRLERYALERGLTTLKPGIPQNRALLRAFREIEENMLNSQKPYVSKCKRLDVNENNSIVIDLPRYSWSTLGRLLLQAYKSNDATTIRLKVSPLLTLSPLVLGMICEFLGLSNNEGDGDVSVDVTNLESTCRSLSVDVISARALIEKTRNLRLKQIEHEMSQILEDEKNLESQTNFDVDNDGADFDHAKFLRVHRTSKRVQSQLLTSEKEAERITKRKSVEYCLISSVIPCTIDSPVYSHLIGKYNWAKLEMFQPLTKIKTQFFSNSPKLDSQSGCETICTKTIKHFESQTSLPLLYDFIGGYNTSATSASDLLHKYLTLIASNVDEVCKNEYGGTVLLISCISECLETATTINKDDYSMQIPWYGELKVSPDSDENITTAIETLAINVLAAELDMRGCERRGQSDGIDSNMEKISIILPYLTQHLSLLSECNIPISHSKLFVQLSVRVHWLSALFYFFWSKDAVKISDGKEAEKLALTNIENAINILNEHAFNKPIKTPQLKSPRRSGDHWAELSETTLSVFRDEIESSSLVSHCRQQYLDLLSTWKKNGHYFISEVSNEDQLLMQSIGLKLFQRYELESEKVTCGVKMEELIDEFINTHPSFSPTIVEDDVNGENITPNQWPSLWKLLPTQDVPISLDALSKSSFVTLLSLTLLHRNDSKLHLASFLASFIIAVSKQFSSEDARIKDSKHMTSVEDDTDDDAAYDNGKRIRATHRKNTVLTQMIHFLLSKLWNLLEEATEDEIERIMDAVDVLGLIQLSLEISSGYFSLSTNDENYGVLYQIPQNHDLLKTCLAFSCMIKERVMDNMPNYDFVSGVFGCLCAILVRERELLSGLLQKINKQYGRAEKKKVCCQRSKYIATVASEIAVLLSNHPNVITDIQLEESFLIKKLVTVNSAKGQSSLAPLAILAESISWFWTFVSNADAKVKYYLRVPIAATIIGLIGSSGHSNSETVISAMSQTENQRRKENSATFSLSDYFASDDSAKGWIEKDEKDERNGNTNRRALLHALCRGVQCIGIVFSDINDAEMTASQKCFISLTHDKPFLPLIASRVLGFIADFVLDKLSESGDSNLWAEEYPYGFRSAGLQLDMLLHKVYRCLYGVHLSMQTNHALSQNAYAIPTPVSGITNSSSKTENYSPESIQASAQLYRCIMRAYSGGRRTIPSFALDCVITSLPQVEESPTVNEIKKYLYDAKRNTTLDSVETCENIFEPTKTTEFPEGFPHLILQKSIDKFVDDISIIRKGIYEYFCSGSLPSMDSNATSSNSDGTGVQERKTASKTERLVFKKFEYIVRSLHYNPHDASKWYRAGLCVGVKIDIIMDRLSKVDSAYDSNSFYIKRYTSLKERDDEFGEDSLPPNNLLGKQFSEHLNYLKRNEILHDITHDIFLKSEWSSLTSLRDCYYQLKKILKARPRGNGSEIWSLVESKFDDGDVSSWQFLLGQIFLNSLQAIREKCFFAAFFLSKEKHEDANLNAEISESLGTMLYNDVGFSMKSVPEYQIRKRSKAAQIFFEMALKSTQQNKEVDDLVEYELYFMIGKCQEKIAKSLQAEAYERETSKTRLYEVVMSKALANYHKALGAAHEFEKEYGIIDVQGGGSAHGIIEIIYRLHASRLKVLLCAIKKSRTERNFAEIEALRVTESHWFEERESTREHPLPNDVRERIWNVLTDIVQSMVFCRKEQPFFHRSIYRHAQALLWAPLFHDPDGYIKVGSLAAVPAHKSYRLRGLSSGSCVKSAEAILNSLFDKKRPQLCAVWVTTPPSPSPFEYINDSSRKFDRLRWKYIGAFIDTMKLCQKRTILESFIKWCYSTSCDLPSFYNTTVEGEGDNLQNSHSFDNLFLRETGLIYLAIKYTNAAMAETICYEIDQIQNQKMDEDKWSKKLNELMGEAFQSFLRLNCPINSSLWQSSKIKYKVSNGKVMEVEALCKVFIALKGIALSAAAKMTWEQKMLILRSALREAKSLFPAMALKSESMRHRKKRKQIDFSDINKVNQPEEEPETSSRKIVVRVPENLREGETFYVTVEGGEWFSRMIQLKATTTKRISFNLDVPTFVGSNIITMNTVEKS